MTPFSRSSASDEINQSPDTVAALLAGPLVSAVEPLSFSWATATRGGGFQLFGKNLAEVINATDNRIRVDVIAIKGSRQNLELFEAGEVCVGQVEGRSN